MMGVDGFYPDANFILIILTIVGIAVYLNISSCPDMPKMVLKRKLGNRMLQLAEGITILQRPYVPPKLWGRSGHLQTAVYGALKHSSLNRERDKRVEVHLSDGSTVTFDIFEPSMHHASNLDLTLVLVPGISNCAESNYIRTCIHHALGFGFRCVALNHIGVIMSVKVTGNRIFNYGITEEVTAMMDYLYKSYPQTLFINVGFSMGGNLTTLYMLRTPKEQRSRVIMAMSICQGYSATTSMPLYHHWSQGRRFYNQMIVENVKRILRRNYDKVVAPHVDSGIIDEEKLWDCSSIASLDENYNRHVAGYSSLDSFYEWCSCLPLLEKLDLPVIFLNSEDDPVIPPELFAPVQTMCEEREDMAFVSTKHGGHLGFLEGGFLYPRSVTWLDKFIVEAANQAVLLYAPKEAVL